MASSESWITVKEDSGFSLENLPFGIFSTVGNEVPRPGVAIGETVIDLSVLSVSPGFSETFPMITSPEILQRGTLNEFAGLGRSITGAFRARLQEVLTKGGKFKEFLEDNEDVKGEALVPLGEVKMHLPVSVGDYTDFFAGYHHAHHCGVMFRGPEKALERNYLHIPVAYHGRASSVVVSGTEVKRPRGQYFDVSKDAPVQGDCQCLDFELELGCIIGKGNAQGDNIPVDSAGEHIFGFVLLNDWSARDIQKWEYIPLGPFNGKNFATSISAWVVLADALEAFKTEALEPKGKSVLPYLKETEKKSVYDIQLRVAVKNEHDPASTCVAQVSSKNLMWSFPQMIAHHTMGGCPLKAGDLLGSGTISGTTDGTRGSLLEITEAGKRKISLTSGGQMTYLRGGDVVKFEGVCVGQDGKRIGFGECIGKVIG